MLSDRKLLVHITSVPQLCPSMSKKVYNRELLTPQHYLVFSPRTVSARWKLFGMNHPGSNVKSISFSDDQIIYVKGKYPNAIKQRLEKSSKQFQHPIHHIETQNKPE